MNNHHLPKTPHSFWLATGHGSSYPKLKENLHIDIAIIGGGIAGILTAYALHKAGKEVALFEGRQFLNGTTGNTTAKLSAQHQLIYDELINRYGEKHAKLYYDANMEGIHYIKQLAEELQIDCEIEEESAYVYTENPAFKKQFEAEADAYKNLNIKGSLLTELPFNNKVEYALRMDNQLQFHPAKFLHGVLNELNNQNTPIYEYSLIKDVQQNSEQTIQLKTEDGYTVTCNHAVFATHFPTFDPDNFYTQIDPEISYALLYKTDEAPFEGMYINTDSPKRTFRNVKMDEENYLLVGGESHPIGDEYSELSRYKEIDQFAKQTFGVKDALYRWSSHDLMTKDRVPFIGNLHADYPNMYTATGFSKWGLANAASGAILITDSIFGRKNAYQAIFHPQRDMPDPEKSEQQANDEDSHIETLNLRENVDDLIPGEATIIKENDEEQTGVYKDEKNNLHYLDLSCTHLGCGVQWNNGDKTWDCPCHGSRFNAVGEVIEGPALTNLKQK